MSMDTRQQLEELYHRREQAHLDIQRSQAKERRLDESISAMERELGIESAKPNLWERLTKRIKGGE